MNALSFYLDQRLALAVRYTQSLLARPGQSRLAKRGWAAVDFVARAANHVWRNRRYLTLLKLGNMALVNLQFHFKTERVWGLPYRMKIESTNICNTHCQLCPTGLGLPGRAKGKMSLENFTKLVDRLKATLYCLDLSMWGDPLIVPDIFKMIRYAHDQRIWTYLSSNLHAFKPEKGQAEALIQSGLDMLTCSLHGATQATYEAYQPGKRLDEAIAKIRHLVKTRQRLKSATPKIQLNFVVTKQNEHEIEAFKRLAEDLDCTPVFSHASMNVRLMDKPQAQTVSLGLADDLKKKAEVREHLDRWLPSNRKYVLKSYSLIRDGQYDPAAYNGRKIYNCFWPWQASVVNWDGQVVLCCGSWDPGEDMGNVFEQSFSSIWNGQRYRMARRSFTKPVQGDLAASVACASCPGYMP